VGAENPGQDASPTGGGWAAIIATAFAYFGVVFCVGFMFAAIRTLVIAPMIGEVSAESLDAAIMLAVYWIVGGWSLRQFKVVSGALSRVAIGALAFVMLMAAEFAVASLLFARAPVTVFQSYGTPAGAIRLASQIGFAAIPLLRGRLAPR